MGNDDFGWIYDCDDTLGGRLSLARESRALTIEQVAIAINAPADTVRYWESDRAAPSPDRLLVIAEALHVAASWLMTGFGHGPHWEDLTEVPCRSTARSALFGHPSHDLR